MRNSFISILIILFNTLPDTVELSTAENSLVYQYLLFQILPLFSEPIYILDEFLDENTHLFTLVGVFAALTIYLQTIGQRLNNPEFINYGLVVGFLIVIFLSLIIVAKMLPYFHRTSSISRSTETWGLLIFAIFYIQVIALTIGVVSQFGQILSLYIIVFVIFTGEIITLVVLFGFLRLVGNIANRFDRMGFFIIGATVFLMLIFGGFLLYNIPEIPQITEIEGLITLTQASAFGYYIMLVVYVLITVMLGLGVIILTPVWLWKQRDLFFNYLAQVRRLIPFI